MQIASPSKAKALALAGLCTAVLAVLAPFSIAIGPVSLTLSLLGVFFTGAMLTPGWAPASVLAYTFLGAVGLPVFANMAAGVQVLVGVTGGYLWTYPLMAALLSWTCRRTRHFALRLVGVVAGQLVCYLLGTVWFVFVTGMGVWGSLSLCVFPFIVPDFLKGLCALLMAGAVRRRLRL